MIASEKKVSLFGSNVDLIDASFSSYMNKNDPTVIKLTPINAKKKVEDGEIGIFGAEKYFKGAMDEQLPTPRTPQTTNPTITNHHPKEDQIQKYEEPPKLKTGSSTPSVRSESSWNSRSGLLANNGNHRRNIQRSQKEKTGGVKSLLASLGCNCNDNASVKITEKKVLVKELPKPLPKPPAKFAGGFADDKIGMKKEDSFVFPVLNTFPTTKTGVPEVEESDITHVKTRRNSLEPFGSPVLERGKKSFSLERKLTMLNWDGVTPRSENIGENNNDAASDASSDLFEIESFSTNGNNSFLARQVSNGRSSNATNGYAPSEASIAWSVVTASVAGFSIISDYEDTPTSKTHNMERMIRGTGILSGCTNHKSVRVAGEHLVVSGGNKAVVTGGAAAKDRCRLDSVGTIMKFQTESKPTRASHHLYIQQQ